MIEEQRLNRLRQAIAREVAKHAPVRKIEKVNDENGCYLLVRESKDNKTSNVRIPIYPSQYNQNSTIQ